MCARLYHIFRRINTSKMTFQQTRKESFYRRDGGSAFPDAARGPPLFPTFPALPTLLLLLPPPLVLPVLVFWRGAGAGAGLDAAGAELGTADTELVFADADFAAAPAVYCGAV